MNILHVITDLPKAAGTSVFCCEVANGLVVSGHEVTIAVGNFNNKDHYPLDPHVKVIPIASLFQCTNHYPQTTNCYDLVHIHALWSPVLHRVSKWAHNKGIPVVWSPHGMLQKWAIKNKWWKKIAALALYQWWDLKKADLLHATAQTEVEDIRRLHLGNKIVVAPLGVKVSAGVECKIHAGGKKVLLFVSRVQKKKGLPVLINAWARLPQCVRDGWNIRIVGPDQDSHTAELRKQCERLGVTDYFSFVGPKYGDELDKEYRLADLFVLPTHSENFGSVVVEALARSVPVICSQGAPWKELEDYGCGWWPRDSVAELAIAIESAMNLSDAERCEMGNCGRKLVENKYTWNAVVNHMTTAYEEIVEEGDD